MTFTQSLDQFYEEKQGLSAETKTFLEKLLFLENQFGMYASWLKEGDADYEMLADENKYMAEALLKLGYTQEQISDICTGAPIIK